MLIVDAHLDLAFNALNGRDVLLPAAQQPENEDGVATVGLPDLHRGGAGLVCATIFCEPAKWRQKPGGYATADEAHAMAWEQMAWYQRQRDTGAMRFVTRRSELPNDAATSSLAVLLLMEGGDALRTAEDVRVFYDAGVRIVGLAWKRTFLAGGTGEPGPLTETGVRIVKALDDAGFIHDASHLAEESFWQLLEISDGPVMASHSNCRSIVPTDRQLSDEMIRAIIQRGGVIGINFYDKFLLEKEQYGKRRATFEDVVRHVRHMCDLAGDATHVGIGTDMDGGFGRAQVPHEITDAGDLPRLADALAAGGFGDQEIEGIMGENWLAFFRKHLP